MTNNRVITLKDVWDDYKALRTLRPKTLSSYQSSLHLHLADFMDTDLISITKEKVVQRHKAISKVSPTSANCTMRCLRALYGFAIVYYDLPVNSNPVSALSKLGGWNRERPRTNYIRPEQMETWFHSVLSLDSRNVRDFLLVLILTGLRLSEAQRLRWEDVDLANKTLTVRDTKNHDDHILPLGRFLERLLLLRCASRNGEFVFPGRFQGKPMGAIHGRKKVSLDTNVPFSHHDLRRTFLTCADAVELPLHIIKRLANHRQKKDITERYIILAIERLRQPMQQIEDYILRNAGLEKPSGDFLQNTSSQTDLKELLNMKPRGKKPHIVWKRIGPTASTRSESKTGWIG